MELRSCNEFLGKEGMQLDGMLNNDRKSLTSLGLPLSTHGELKMWQMMLEMQPIIERTKDTNEVWKISKF